MDSKEKQEFFDVFNQDQDDIENHLKTLPDNKEKLKYLYQWKTDRLTVYSFKDKIKHFLPEGVEQWDEKQLDVALEYVEIEIEHLENLERLGTGAEVPKFTRSHKLTDETKPKLTQVQISILFRIMKDLGIIANRDLSKKDYSQIIESLTGYSANTLRINFSAELNVISDRPQDYQEIIDYMKAIIDKLERAKGEIS